MLTYFPLKNLGTDPGFILTSSRNKALGPLPPHPPASYQFGKLELVFPEDGGKTWMVVSSDQTTLAFSVGNFSLREDNSLHPADFFRYNSVGQFVHLHDFTDMSPFQLIIAQTQSPAGLYEVNWDGKKGCLLEHSPDQPYLWLPSDVAYREERETAFRLFLQHEEACELEDLLRFHHFANRNLGIQQQQAELAASLPADTLSVVRNAFETEIYFENFTNYSCNCLSI
jgi:hypothetical protein